MLDSVFRPFADGCNVDSDGKPYWDGKSSDGTNMNIGNWLTRTGGFSSDTTSPLINPPYWGFPLGDPNYGKADLNFYVSSTTSSNVVLQLEVAGYAGSNESGYYDPGIGAASRIMLFNGPASPTATAAIILSGDRDIGFYIHVTANSKDEYYYTESKLNTRNGDTTAYDRSFQHFALFGLSDGSYYVGAEDLFSSNSDKDYQDLVVKVTPQHVPEAGALLLFGTGLAGLVGYRRVRRMR